MLFHILAQIGACGLILLALWSAAEALGAADRLEIRRALRRPPSRLRAAQARLIGSTSLCVAALAAAGALAAG